MAIFDFQLSTITRSTGRSAVAASAYRGGGLLVDSRTGDVFDYRRRRGICSEIMVPADLSVPFLGDVYSLERVRSLLWNGAELAEGRRNAVTAREIRLALPHELTPAENRNLVVAFMRELVEEFHVAAEVAFHEAPRGGDERNRHAHCLFTTREVGDGFTFGRKTRQLDERATGSLILSRWRRRWAEEVNSALSSAGHDARVDHRSLADRGLDREPNEHLGPSRTYQIRALNRQYEIIRAEAEALDEEIIKEAMPVWANEAVEDVGIGNATLAEQAWIEAAEEMRLARELQQRRDREEELNRTEEEALERARERLARLRSGHEARARLGRIVQAGSERMAARYGRAISEQIDFIGSAVDWNDQLLLGDIARFIVLDPNDRTPSGQRRFLTFLENAVPKALSRIRVDRGSAVVILDEGSVVGRLDPGIEAPAHERRRAERPDRKHVEKTEERSNELPVLVTPTKAEAETDDAVDRHATMMKRLVVGGEAEVDAAQERLRRQKAGDLSQAKLPSKKQLAPSRIRMPAGPKMPVGFSASRSRFECEGDVAKPLRSRAQKGEVAERKASSVQPSSPTTSTGSPGETDRPSHDEIASDRPRPPNKSPTQNHPGKPEHFKAPPMPWKGGKGWVQLTPKKAGRKRTRSTRRDTDRDR